MTFKSNWEKTDSHFQLPENMLQHMVEMYFGSKPLLKWHVISGGCANLNIKVDIKDEPHPYILRIYLREKNAAITEEKLSKLLKPMVPIPQVYFVGDCHHHRFAVIEYIPGITLRDLLLGTEPHDVGKLMEEAGIWLSKIQNQHFSKSGFFDKNLNVIKANPEDNYLNYTLNCLDRPNVIEQLGGKRIKMLRNIILENSAAFPHESESHLVHADFDPANILVNKVDENWEVSAILDWEFAFSGSPLCDVANMLRYAHQMPSVFESAFLKGLKQGGVILSPTGVCRLTY